MKNVYKQFEFDWLNMVKPDRNDYVEIEDYQIDLSNYYLRYNNIIDRFKLSLQIEYKLIHYPKFNELWKFIECNWDSAFDLPSGLMAIEMALVSILNFLVI